MGISELTVAVFTVVDDDDRLPLVDHLRAYLVDLVAERDLSVEGK